MPFLAFTHCSAQQHVLSSFHLPLSLFFHTLNHFLLGAGGGGAQKLRNGVGSGLSFSELLPVGQFHLGWKFLWLKNQYFTWGSARRRVGHSEPHQLSTALQPVLVSSNFKSLKVLGGGLVVFSI